jgi:hypothetical protein
MPGKKNQMSFVSLEKFQKDPFSAEMSTYHLMVVYTAREAATTADATSEILVYIPMCPLDLSWMVMFGCQTKAVDIVWMAFMSVSGKC